MPSIPVHRADLERDSEVSPNGVETTVFPDLSGLFMSERYSDLVIRCKEKHFRAHCAIVCPQSTVLDAAVRVTQATKHSVSLTNGYLLDLDGPTDVSLHSDEPDTLQRLLEFMYTGTYQETRLSRKTKVKKPKGDGLSASSGDTCTLQGDEQVGIEEYEENRYARSLTDHYWGDGWYVDDGNLNRGDTDAEDEDDESEDEEDNYDDDDEGDVDEDDSDSDESYVGHSSESASSEPSTDDDDDDDDEEMGDAEDIAAELNSDEELQVPKRHRCRSLFAHLRVYLLADKYKVEPLRKLARHRFKMEAEIVYRTAPEWPDVVDELLATSRDDDHFIRDIPTVLTASMLNTEAKFHWRMFPILQKHGGFTLRVMDHLAMSQKLSLTTHDRKLEA
ncbi:hypothetical protein B0T14DRAFT_567968 [Immersiella caudata]|uniref:BTB domain-containing protein n=1 Tax=Immersiella caudata TaxID=314043 RepID=A0AA39WJ71_9PEZI|nr:hypothetical protein B0T14DRAFT_567968 [Immersiella caudata]